MCLAAELCSRNDAICTEVVDRGIRLEKRPSYIKKGRVNNRT